MNYLALFERSHQMAIEGDCCNTDSPMSKLEYLNHIFDFTTYDSGLDEFFVSKALQVCEAISNKTTFDYIRQSEDHYLWFITMCNMPFFIDKLNWGTSIRGAWWDIHLDDTFVIKSTGLWDENNEQILKLELNEGEWKEFIAAMLEYGELK